MTVDENIKAVLADLRQTSKELASNKEAYFRQHKPLPPSIGLDGGGMVFIGHEGVRAIHSIAQSIRGNNIAYRRSLTPSEMSDRVRKAIGKILAKGRQANSSVYDLPRDEDKFCAEVRAEIAERMDGLTASADHIFGAWVIQGDSLKCIEVGPVRFELRGIWCQRLEASGALTAEEAAAIRSHWASFPVPKSTTISNIRAREAVEAIGQCPWVCSVRVAGHSVERSITKALVATKIALACIALSWHSPSSQAKETGLVWDLGGSRSRNMMFLTADGQVGASHRSVMRLGRYLTPNDAAEFPKTAASRLDAVGRALDTFLAVSPSSPKRRMEEVLCQALIWFYEACNEPLDFMAIVKFAAALDTMARGKKTKGITALVKRRLGLPDDEHAVLNDGTKLSALIKQVYETGRSQIVHGTSASLIDDLEQLRARAELITTETLRVCCEWLGGYAGPDEVDAFTTAP